MEAENPKSEIAKKEEEILKFWQENKIFEQTLAKPAPQGEFVFYEGPPYANGLPGIHHLEARAFKDVILRYRTMRGFHVSRRAGWDTHGLPIEMAVEKKLGLTSKKEIEEKVGIDKFVAASKENVFFYKAEWEKFTRRIGYWLDFEQAYLTMSADYMESIWWIIKQSYEQRLLYKDYKVLPWCPRCGTALSSHELAQGYKEVKDTALYVKFKVKPGQKIGGWTSTDKTYFIAWTTTPWTLPGNVALAVGEGIEYRLEEKDGEYFIAARQSKFFAPSDSSGMASREEIQIAAGQLIGLEYEPLYPYLKDNLPPSEQKKLANTFKIYPADFVSTSEGTGIVHTAVMYGADDFELGTKIGLPKFHLVNTAGEFIAGLGDFSDKPVTEANVDIIIDLKKRGLLFKQEKVVHTYPFCWRCQTPLIYYARDSWYIKMSALREKLLAENDRINWIPAHIKDGRFGEWLREVKDWAISRERYWGTPLPVWQSADREEKLVIGSIEELKKHTKRSGNRYFVMRHGEAENNVLGIINSGDTKLYPLTKLGRDQVHAAVASLPAKKITRIYTSPFLRTRESAEIIADKLGLSRDKIILDDRLREFNFGQLDGRPFVDFLDYEGKKMLSYDDSVPAGESYLEAKRRFGNFIYEIEKNFTNEIILIVTHGIGPEVLEAIVRGANAMESKEIINTFEPPVAKPYELTFIPLPHNADYELDLHRPFIDQVELISEAGTSLKRVSEVLDVWFDSGAMPFAQDHYPFSKKGILYPADFIAEAIDQTRGWFYTLLAVGVLVGRGTPYKNVICLGHILDVESKKMSKSIGNVVDPRLVIDKYGADALRFWMYTINQPGESKNFNEASVIELIKKFINPLVNVLAFYKLYRNEEAASAEISESSPILDRWLTALQDDLIRQVTLDLEKYQITEAARALRDFVVHLSQWYVRRSRERFRGGDSAEQARATAVLGFTLRQLAKLLAPFMPFLAEQIYQQLRRSSESASVHLTDWPDIKNSKFKTQNSKLLEKMAELRRLASLALEARMRAGVKVRQPLARLAVCGSKNFSHELIDLIKAEVNVKEVVWQMDLPAAVVLDTTITPELKLAGDLRELIRQIQDLRKRAGLRPGEPAVLLVSAKHAARALIAAQADALRRAASLKEIKFGDFLDAELSISH